MSDFLAVRETCKTISLSTTGAKERTLDSFVFSAEETSVSTSVVGGGWLVGGRGEGEGRRDVDINYAV